MFYTEYELDYYNEQVVKVNNFIQTKKLLCINDNEIKVGDKIVVNFYSFSQKYMYMLYPKYGEVIENNNISIEGYSLMNIILKNDDENYNAFHESVCLYSRGFDYQVLKLV